jgi:hypothetical protein
MWGRQKYIWQEGRACRLWRSLPSGQCVSFLIFPCSFKMSHNSGRRLVTIAVSSPAIGRCSVVGQHRWRVVYNLESAANKDDIRAICQWLTPVIQAAQEAEIKRITVESQPGLAFLGTLSRKKKNQHIKGLVEWLKVEIVKAS